MNNKSSTSRIKYPASCARGIYDRFVIKHKKIAQDIQIFYQCSVCGFIAAKLRQSSSLFCKNQDCYSQRRLFTIDLNLQNLSYVQYRNCVGFLIDCQNGNPLPKQKIQNMRQEEYVNWRINYNHLRLNPKEAEQDQQEKNKKIIQQATYFREQLERTTNKIKEYQRQISKMQIMGIEAPLKRQLREEATVDLLAILTPIFRKKVTSEVSRLFQTDNWESQTSMQIVQSMTNYICGYNFYDLNHQWKKSVSALLQQKLKQRHPKKDQNRRREHNTLMKRVAEILLKIPIKTIKDPQLFLERIKVQKIYVQKSIVSFVNCLIDNRKLQIQRIRPKIIQKYNKKDKSVIDYDYLKYQISVLVKGGNRTMACDLWFCFVMGLRIPDLKRVFIRDEQIFFDYISIFQRKNSNEAIRIVPTSLRMLCVWSDTTYPINEERLESLKQFCKHYFGRFYSLRQLCITRTFTGLISKSDFQPHRQSSTTLKYYVNYNDFQLMDSVFSLPLHFENQQLNLKHIYARSGKKAQFGEGFNPILKDVNQFQGTITLPSSINQRQEKQIQSFDMLFGKIKELAKYQQIQKTVSSTFCFVNNLLQDQQYSRYLIQVCYDLQNLIPVLSQLLNEAIIVVYNEKALLFENLNILQTIQQKQYQKLCQFYNRQKSNEIGDKEITQNELNYMNENNQLDQIFFQKDKDEIDENEDQIENNFQIQKQDIKLQRILLGNTKTTKEIPITFQKCQQVILQSYPSILTKGVQQADVESVINKSNIIVGFDTHGTTSTFTVIKKKQIAINNRQLRKRLVRPSNLFLQNQYCRDCGLELDLQKCVHCGTGIITCECIVNNMYQKCNCLKSQGKINKYFDVRAGPKSQIDDFLLVKPNFLDFKNNIQQTLRKTKRLYINKIWSSKQIKQIIYLNRNILSKSYVRIIEEVRNRQFFLPLQIRKCKQTNKGLGVFALQDIQKNVVIATYCGIVKPQYQIQQSQDSLITLGFNQKKSYIGINCKRAGNVGRFFNSSQNKQQANMRIRIVFINQKQIIPFLFTVKKVYKNSELCWYYGKDFNFSI